MKNWQRICLVFLLSASMILPASAAENVQRQAELFGTQELKQALTPQTQKLLGSTDPTEQRELWEGVLDLLRHAAEDLADGLGSSFVQALRLIVLVVLCQLVDAVCEERGRTAAVMAGVLAAAAICMSDLHTLIGLGRTTMEELADFTAVLNPVMAAASTASGAVTGVGMQYPLTVFFSTVLIRSGHRLLIPAVYAYLALAVADGVQQNDRLKKLRELIGWSMEVIMKAVVYGFTGCLAVTGVLAGTADAARLKAAKLTISGMIPVVGGIISDAAQTVLSGAELLKSSIGTFGMLAILAIFLLPFLRMGLSYLLLKAVTAISGMFSGRLAGFLETVTKAMGYLLGMCGSSALICLLTCCCYLRVVRM